MSTSLEYYSVDHVKNKAEVKSFPFYFDKTAPITAADILGDRYVVGEKVYFSGRTKMKLTAVDNKVGVKEIKYAIDAGDFLTYDQPFYLPSLSGEHVIRYYSIDNLANQATGFEEFKHYVSKIYLDLTGPDIEYAYIGRKFETRDTVFINKETQITFKGNDPESGLKYISYSLNNISEESKYEGPFSITQEGFHRVEFFGVRQCK